MGAAIALFLIFAVACGVATFIESAHGTETAWALVYGTAWFGFVQLLLGLNLLYNLFKFKLFTLKKLPALVFHASFLFMLVGAALTRYVGVEGQMHIREGGVADSFVTAQSYIQLRAFDKNVSFIASEPKYISRTGQNNFKINLDVDGEKAVMTYKSYLPNAVYGWKEAEGGEPVVELMFSSEERSQNVVLRRGQSIEAGALSVSFEDKPTQPNFVQISLRDGEFFISTNADLNVTSMTDMSVSAVEKNKELKFEPLKLYRTGELDFAAKNLLAHATHGVKEAGSNVKGVPAIVAELDFKGVKREVVMFENSMPMPVKVADKYFEAGWSPMSVRLPFAIKLDDFELKRYPGSNSPMSYSSYVQILDNNASEPYHIYMNHVLDKNGYRFFQNSYDQDELGTVLSVNQDPGKIPTYIGYFLLSLGLLLNIINPYSRFRKLSNLINKSDEQSAEGSNLKKSGKKASSNLKSLLAIFTLGAAIFGASVSEAAPMRDSSMNLPRIDEAHSAQIATLIVQSADGRMKPFDTVGHEVLNKLYRSDKYEGMKARDVVLSMMVNSDFWRKAPIVKVSDKQLKKILEIPETQKFACFEDFFAKDGEYSYKLTKYSELANRKAPASRGTFDKEVIKADEKLNILYMVFMGEMFRTLPKQNDANNTWYSPAGASMNFSGEEGTRAVSLLQDYFTGVVDAQNSGDWSEANAALSALKEYQSKYGASVMPSENKIKFELAFNKYKIFERLTPVYLLAGFALLIVVFAKMIAPRLRLNLAFKAVYYINIAAFIAHTMGLGMRWYIAEHAPWSDSYESMVYIAWALAFSGMIFSRRSAIALALTSILAGVTLFVAHLSWLDPQITNLVPVLKSYWLTIHVSVITASYGFLGLCSLLGFFTLVLFAIQGKKENKELTRNILEATRINEMAMILGLSLLVVGNFLGGVWANESWGRYWGWDSKETWALVSILVYAAVVHMRFVPSLNSQYAFAVASLFAYCAIIMTYFGVNFYLSGMHSYAAGDPVPVPDFVWISLAIMIGVSLAALRGKGYSKTL